jgi:hypothetical protein
LKNILDHRALHLSNLRRPFRRESHVRFLPWGGDVLKNGVSSVQLATLTQPGFDSTFNASTWRSW